MTSMTLYCAMIIMVTMGIHGQQENQRYPWVIRLQVSSLEYTDYWGQLKMTITFNDFSSESMVTPNEHYVRSDVYEFPVQLKSNGTILAVSLISSGLCINGEPVTKLRLDWLELTSESSKMTYSRHNLNFDPISDACQDKTGLILFDFDTISIKSCSIGDAIYEDGQMFDLECSARCKCTNGTIGCVDMCPPYLWVPSGLDEICTELYKPNRCCPELGCLNLTTGHLSHFMTNEKPQETEKCKTNFETSDFGSLVGYGDNQESHSKDMAIVLNNKWAIATELNSPENQSSVPHLHIARSTFPNPLTLKIVSTSTNVTSSNLTLLKIEDYFPASLSVQQANLPLNQDHCRQLLMSNECPKIAVSWPTPSSNGNGSNSLKWFPANSCDPNLHKSRISCIIETDNQNCTNGQSKTPGPIALFAYHGGFQFLIGLKSRDSQPMPCSLYDIVAFDTICESLEWIKATVNQY